MPVIKDLTVTFPVGDCDSADFDGAKKKIMSCFEDGTFSDCFRNLGEQVKHLATSPTRGGEVGCKVDSGGKVTCEGKWTW